jgi:hypothetical protein
MSSAATSPYPLGINYESDNDMDIDSDAEGESVDDVHSPHIPQPLPVAGPSSFAGDNIDSVRFQH